MYAAKITIDHTKVAASLTDFPVYVDLSHLPSSFWDNVANGGGDIRCYKSDGTTELPREVVACDTATDTGELHIKYTGTLSNSVDTEIQIHVDGTSSDYAVTDTYGRNNVWKSGYKAVLHHQSSGVDSSGNGDWTVNGSPSYTALAPSNGVDISATTKYATRNNDGGLTRSAAFTVSGITKFKTTTTGHVIFCWGDYAQSFYYELRYENIGGGWKLCSIKQTGSEIRNDVAYTANTTDPTHVAMRFNGTSLVHYAEGTQIGTQNPAAGSASNSFMDNMSIGAIPHSTGYMQNFWGNNIQSETRFYLGDLGVDWLTTEKNNLRAPATFYTAASGSTNVTVTPAAQSVTASVPAYTVATQKFVTVAPAVQVGTFSIPAYTVSLPKIVAPAAQSATFSIPLYTIDAGGNITLAIGAQSATFSIPAYSVAVQRFVTVAPSVQVGTFSTQAPTVVAGTGVTLQPATQEGTFTIPAYSIIREQNTTVPMSVVTATFSIPTLLKVGAVWVKRARQTTADWSRTSRNSS